MKIQDEHYALYCVFMLVYNLCKIIMNNVVECMYTHVCTVCLNDVWSRFVCSDEHCRS